MVWMVLSSFKSNRAIFSSPFALPDSIDLSRWAEAWEVGNLGQYALNSAIVTGVSVTLILVIGVGRGVRLQPLPVPGPRRSRWGSSRSGCCCRCSRTSSPSRTSSRTSPSPTRAGRSIIPYTAMGLPLAVFLLKVYLDGLPEELFEAARIDGAGDGRIFRRSRMPLLRPGLATVAHLLRAGGLERVPAGAAVHPGRRAQDDPDRAAGLLVSRYQTDYSLLFSALSIVTIPMIVIYIVFNRHIVDGITAGSVK